MAASENNLDVLLLLVVLSPFIHSEESGCASIEFPTLKDNTITLRENSTLDLPFLVRSVRPCPDVQSRPPYVTVRQMYNETREIRNVCSLRKHNGKCFSFHHSPCECEPEDNKYRLTMTVNRSDNTAWEWSLDKMVERRTLFFNVEYDAKVIDLHLQGANPEIPVDKDTTAHIICTWENGNPPTQARLLGKYGNELKRQQKSGQIRHTLQKVECKHTGIYRCEASGADQNRTTTLLVKCPPELTIATNEMTILAGGDIRLTVNFTSYSNITDCRLWKLFRSETSRDPQTCDITSIKGGPPEMTLSVWLEDIEESDDGEWRLELTNDMGPGHLDFRVRVKSKHHLPEVKLARTELTVASGASVELLVNITSHTRNITRCSLEKMFRSENSRGRQQCDLTNLTGNPPDLMLTILLDDVTEADDGVWRLTMTNDVGPGFVDIRLRVEIAQEAGMLEIPVSVVAAVVCALVAIVAAVVLHCRRCHWCTRQRTVNGDRLERQASLEQNIYWEIPDESVRNVPAEPPRPCTRRERRKDYIHAVLLPEEMKQANSEDCIKLFPLRKNSQSLPLDDSEVPDKKLAEMPPQGKDFEGTDSAGSEASMMSRENVGDKFSDDKLASAPACAAMDGKCDAETGARAVYSESEGSPQNDCKTNLSS